MSAEFLNGGSSLSGATEFSQMAAGAATTPTGTGVGFTRASASATVQTATDTIVLGLGTNVAGIGRSVTANKRGVLNEESRINVCQRNQAETVAPWAVGTAPETANYGVVADPAGTNLSTRFNCASGEYGRYMPPVLTAAVYSVSAYQRGTSGSLTNQWLVNIGGAVAIQHAITTAWARKTDSRTYAANAVNFEPVDGRGVGGGSAAARDVLTTLEQIELGKFATSVMITAGADTTRAGTRFQYLTPLKRISGGRLNLEIDCYALGGGGDYTADMYLWSDPADATTFCKINFTTRVLTVSIGGVSSTTAALTTWAQGDRLKFFVGAGGSKATFVAFQIGTTAPTFPAIGGTSVLGNLAPAGVLDLLNAAAAGQFSCWMIAERTYRGTTLPGWAVLTGGTDFSQGTEFTTNLLIQSEAMNTSWAATNVTVSANTADTTDPLGGNTADKLTDTNDGASVQHRVAAAEPGAVTTAGAIYTASIYAKAGTKSQVCALTDSGSGGVSFDLLTQVSTVVFGSSTILRYGVVTIGSGWYRVWVTYFKTSGGPWTPFFNIGSANSYTYQGDGTGTIYFWGAMDAPGVLSSSYLATTTQPAIGEIVNSFPDITHTRGSVATVQTGDSTLVPLAIDAIGIGRTSSSNAYGAQNEEPRENIVTNSRDLTGGGWTAGSLVTMTANYAPGPDLSVLADRCNVSNNGWSNYRVGALTVASYTMSAFERATSAASLQGQFSTFEGTAVVGLNFTLTPSWSRQAITRVMSTAGACYWIPVDSEGVAGNSSARDVVVDFTQIEIGKFPSSPIITTGTALTRSGTRLQFSNAVIVRRLSAGRLNLELDLYALGSSTEYSADMFIWSDPADATTYCKINYSTLVMTISVAGVTNTTVALPSWSRGSRLRLFVGAGGSIVSYVAISVDGATAVIPAVSGVALGNIAPAGALDLLNAAAAGQFSCFLVAERTYAGGL